MYVCMGTLLMIVTSSDQGIDGWVILVLTRNGLRVDCQWSHDFIGIVIRHICFRVDNLSSSLYFSCIDQDTPLQVLQNTVFLHFCDILLVVDVTWFYRGSCQCFFFQSLFLVYF